MCTHALVLTYRCRTCEEHKPREEFYTRVAPNRPRRRETACRTCIRARRRTHYATSPGTAARQAARYAAVRDSDPETFNRLWGRAAHLRRYGLTVEGYTRLLCEQDGRCALCLAPTPEDGDLVVDHCHDSGRVRGLLCGACNRALGAIGDTETALLRALAYVRSGQ